MRIPAIVRPAINARPIAEPAMIAAASRTAVRTRITDSAAMAAGLATAAPPMTRIARAARPPPPLGRHPGQRKPSQPKTALFLACFGLPVQLTVGAGAELAGWFTWLAHAALERGPVLVQGQLVQLVGQLQP
jgi:hypothetical protein